MKFLPDRKFDLNDVYLVPNVVSHIRSRSSANVDTSVMLGEHKLGIPIIGSPMKDVCDGSSGDILLNLGCFGIIHRFCSVEKQVHEFNKNKNLGAAVGINGDFLERFQALNSVGCKIFCLDVANGASVVVSEAIEELLKINPSTSFIVGNVASSENYLWLSKIKNVIGVRVGIAGGSACTTRNATGVYCPMASLIMECKSVKRDGMPLIIADGGIKEAQDVCKCLALGADITMLGSTLAGASDSPAELIKQDGLYYKVYHGSASFGIQQVRSEKPPKYIEGKTKLLEFNNETLEQIVSRFADGLRSSMSYFNSKTIKEFQTNAVVCCR